MPGCCAYGCTNRSEQGFKLYSIPDGKHDQERRKLWLSKIQREDFSPNKGVRLCQIHFAFDQFERSNPQKLKPNAVPTIFSYNAEEPMKSGKSPRKRAREKSLAYEEPPFKSIRPKLEHSYADSDDGSMLGNVDEEFEQLGNIIDENESAENNTSSANNEATIFKRKLDTMRKKFRRLKREKQLLEANLEKIFREDQLKVLQSQMPCDIKWSNETVKMATQLRFTCGYSGYHMLLENGYPLPRFLLNKPFATHIATMNQ